MDRPSVVDLHERAPVERTSLLAQAYDRVLTPAFPPSELLAQSKLNAALDAEPPTALVAVALDAPDDPVGCLVGQWFPGSRVLLIAYLAVAASRRSQGLGRALLGAAVGPWTERLGARLVMAEVEDPAVFPATADQDPSARLRFYGREGFARLDLAYTQPEVNRPHGRVPGMFLIVDVNKSPAAKPGSAPSPEHVRSFLAEYYSTVEGPGHDDQAFRALIAAVTDGALVALPR